MNIAIASGKGGTGKTSIAVSLASYLAREGRCTAVIDCDVEEPNAALFLKPDINVTDTVYTPLPVVNEGLCTGCGECERICRFSAIVLVKGEPLVLPAMCHSCGGCALVCPEKAIIEKGREIGVIEEGSCGMLQFAGGRLNIGEAMPVPLIKAVKRHCYGADIRIIDAPPGTSCPAIEAVSGSHYVVLVTEPTPFGLNDFGLAAAMLGELGLSFGAVINRSTGDDAIITDFCRAEKIEVLASIPYSMEAAQEYSKGDVIDYFLEKHEAALGAIAGRVLLRAQGCGKA